ncbi:MAG: hypothetical protein ABSG53_22455 [Thermoguttaceae bacterium]
MASPPQFGHYAPISISYSDSVNPRPGQPRLAANMPAGFDRVQVGRTIAASFRGVDSVRGHCREPTGEHTYKNLILLAWKPVRQQARDFNYFCAIGLGRVGQGWQSLRPSEPENCAKDDEKTNAIWRQHQAVQRNFRQSWSIVDTLRGGVVLESPHALPEGTEVRVEVVGAEGDQPLLDENRQTLGEKLMKFAGKAVGLPEDAALNHDHYLYGARKR